MPNGNVLVNYGQKFCVNFGEFPIQNLLFSVNHIGSLEHEQP
jgi:hypothetical protein